MQQDLIELFQFLHDKNPQARQIALENLLPHTLKHAPHRAIFFHGLQSQTGLQKSQESTTIRDLKLLCRDNLAIAHDAFRALVNLSDSSIIHPYLIDQSFLTFLVSYIVHPQSTLGDLAAMLLSNLTASPRSCTALLALQIPILQSPSSAGPFYPTQSRAGSCAPPVPYPAGHEINAHALPLLIDAFVQGANVGPGVSLDERPRKSELHFLASVFANLSTTLPGRLFFLTPQSSNPLQPEATGRVDYPLTKLVIFTEHKDTIRRGGVSSLIKNCSFYTQGHQAILRPESDTVLVPPSNLSAPGIDALQHILLPLAGPEEFDLDAQEQLPEALQFLPLTKKRESDAVLRLTHVETLLLLCTTRWGRDYLRMHGVYEVVRALHEQETNDAVSEHVERLVNLLKREEGPETEKDPQVEETEEEDDEDLRIEEI
ncbi:hypothetical protein B0F90DRAFT_1874081 [Multifurca ochricompacta]|uniref:Protein HGH1 homolog n=1 Tax=Multifurca ochricompacta TaxID=376703 RepID=A0AAD4QRD9_9AGAM|nr:hypothetical protein B0F90DRAFT_1874081 [Multifurca ochricompacta]